MKKLALLLFITTGIISLSAQAGLKIGVRVGPTFSTTTILDATDKTILDIGQSGNSGWTLGVIANQGFSENYAFQIGANIVRRGFSYQRVDTSGVTTDVANRVTGLEVPLGLKLVTNEIGNNGMRVMGRFGVTLNANVGFRQTETVGSEPPEANQRANQINKIGSTIFAGAGFQFERDWGTLAFDLSYHHALVNINNKRNGIPNAIARLHYLALGGTYYF